MIARSKQKLSANVQRTLFIWTHVNWRVPVESQFPFAIILLWLDAAAFQRFAIYTFNFATLRFDVSVIVVRGIGEREESVATAKFSQRLLVIPPGYEESATHTLLSCSPPKT